ncbi:ParB/RepB/Spo0J family partition protein [Bacillus fonticola]|uniref:ParB/RepB/Spo0J family partition protein n=1 Tax=Bacillus fonticola TaxID=2728853 RepID=UPI001472701A|nr:ParB/RepB/Spo0J family partition protein [Bacillus fonticola]
MAKGLGKGINALFANLDVEKEEMVQEIALQDIRPNPYQPRKVFEEGAIEELSQSIREHGVLQPIIVRKSSIRGFEIVVGERRYRATKEAGRATIPAVVRELTDKQLMELAVLENLQREDLTPIEEAHAYQTLMDKLSLTQEQLAKRIGKSRPHIANHVRLLGLPEKVQTYLTDGVLTMGHGRALLGLKKKDTIEKVVQKVLTEGLNVRQLEDLIQSLNEQIPPKETKREAKKDVFLVEQEERLRERFGTSVHIKRSKKKGKIEIEFFSEDDLNRLLEMFGSEM